MNNIYYFCPEIDSPCGGVHRIYLHVFWLNAHGFKAHIVHQSNVYADIDVPIITQNDLLIGKEDAVVFPEGNDLKELNKITSRKCLFIQSLAGLFENTSLRDWKDCPPDHVICCSKVIQETLFSVTGINGVLVPNSVDGKMFKPRKKKYTVAYIPYKAPEQYRFVIENVQKTGKYDHYSHFRR
ncbi:hypothetical protein [Desulfonatronum parangueonense]